MDGRHMQEPVLSDIARVWLASILTVASAVKVLQPDGARMYVVRLTGVSRSVAAGIIFGVSAVEIAVATALVVGWFITEAAAIAVGMFVVFTCVLALDRSGGSDCGCFGMHPRQAHRGVDIGRNLGMLFVAAFIVLTADSSAFVTPVIDPLAVGVGVLVAALCGIAYVTVSRLLIVSPSVL